MTKVLRILNRFNLGGPTYNATYLTKFLHPEFETKLIAGIKLESEHGSEFILSNYNIEPIYIDQMQRKLSPLRDFKAFLEIRRIIKEFKPDIVHTHAAKSGALGRLAAYSEKVPIIIHTFHGHVFHSYFGKFKTNFFIKLERFLAKRTTKIITISKSQKKDIAKIYSICDEEKIEIIPLGFDFKKFEQNIDKKRKIFRKEYGIQDDELAIGIIGRLTAIKNHILFLKTIKILLEKNKKLKFFIIGDGEEVDTLKDLATSMNIGYTSHPQTVHDKVLCFTSWVTNIDMAYAGLDIVSLTSLNEGTPVTLIEAQASKKPIVSTNVGGVNDVLIDRETGLLTKSNDPNDFAEKLQELIDNKELRSKISEAGYKNANNQYSYKRLVRDMRELYLTLLEEK